VILVPDQVPPLGAPVNVIGAEPKQVEESGPAKAGVGATTVMRTVSVFVHPLPLVNEYTREKVPVPLGVNIPPEVTFGPVQVPPVGVGVNVNGIA
jgi:hypothetical protein